MVSRFLIPLLLSAVAFAAQTSPYLALRAHYDGRLDAGFPSRVEQERYVVRYLSELYDKIAVDEHLRSLRMAMRTREQIRELPFLDDALGEKDQSLMRRAAGKVLGVGVKVAFLVAGGAGGLAASVVTDWTKDAIMRRADKRYGDKIGGPGTPVFHGQVSYPAMLELILHLQAHDLIQRIENRDAEFDRLREKNIEGMLPSFSIVARDLSGLELAPGGELLSAKLSAGLMSFMVGNPGIEATLGELGRRLAARTESPVARAEFEHLASVFKRGVGEWETIRQTLDQSRLTNGVNTLVKFGQEELHMPIKAAQLLRVAVIASAEKPGRSETSKKILQGTASAINAGCSGFSSACNAVINRCASLLRGKNPGNKNVDKKKS